MPKFNFEGVDYISEDLSEAGAASVAGLRFLRVKMRRIQEEMAVYSAAKQGYVSGLKAELETKPQASE